MNDRAREKKKRREKEEEERGTLIFEISTLQIVQPNLLLGCPCMAPGVSYPKVRPCFLSLSIFFSVIHAAIAGVSPFWRGQLVCRRYRACWRTDSIG